MDTAVHMVAAKTSSVGTKMSFALLLLSLINISCTQTFAASTSFSSLTSFVSGPKSRASRGVKSHVSWNHGPIGRETYCRITMERKGHWIIESPRSDIPELRMKKRKQSDAHDNIINKVDVDSKMDRRNVLKFASVTAAGLASGCTINPFMSRAEPTAVTMPNTPIGDSSSQLENGLLESRVAENLMSPPPYTMEGPDIYYPSFFAGVWNVSSVTTQVDAPCGPVLFGGNATLASARRDIGPAHPLQYRSRFIPDGNGHIIADREFNVREIAKAAMGTKSVVDVSLATPNKFSCLLLPTGIETILSVDLIVLARRSEQIDERNFHCSEVVRQIIAPADRDKPQNQVSTPSAASGRSSILLKEIETISLYSAVEPKEPGGEVTKINCQQRSATFLLPSQQDPVAYQLWQMSRGRPIDVRFYDVTYTKRV